MAGFISESACRGSRPKNVNLVDKHLREDLISKLLSQRSVVRYISAPEGFGKTTLAAQYAELIFSFKDVFWINCASPCFIRDLDSNNIFNQILQLNENTKLVVFDNYHDFGEDRDEIFSNTINNLLEINAEVIVISTPITDNLLKFQHDAFILNSQDLLMHDTDFNFHVEESIFRIPIVAFNNNGLESLLRNASKEKFMNSLIFSLFFIYLLKDGKVNYLEEFLTKSEIKLLIEMNEKYIYFGLNNNDIEFHVPDIPIQNLFAAFSSVYANIFSFLKCKNKNDFVNSMYLILEKHNMKSRLVELAANCSDHVLQLNILDKYSEDCIRNNYIDTALLLFKNIQLSDKEIPSYLPFQAIRLSIFGNTHQAIKYSYSVLENMKSTNINKLLSLYVFLRFGSSIERDKALKIARYIYNDFNVETYLNKPNLTKELKFICKFIKQVFKIYFAILSDSINPFKIWLDDFKSYNDDIGMVCAECILNALPLIKKSFYKDKSFSEFLSCIYKNFMPGKEKEFNFYKYALLKAYFRIDKMLEKFDNIAIWNIDEITMERFNQIDTLLETQKDKFYSRKTKKSTYTSQDISNLALNPIKDKDILVSCENFENVPKLRVKVFGGLSVAIGNKEIINTDFGRQNIKLMCCILAIQNGQEISKDRLSSIIWPEANKYAQRVNINAAWSVMHKIFTLPNSSCPYLVRNQNSYRFLKKYVDCDISLFNDFCADLSLGRLDAYSWYETIKKNSGIIDGELLPSEVKNSYICNKRAEYKNKIVDSLIAASTRLLEADQVKEALWFAQKALERDRTREDVYSQLMKAQLKCGQRTPAIETYLACEKFLKNDMGLTPCSDIKSLYKTALDSSC